MRSPEPRWMGRAGRNRLSATSGVSTRARTEWVRSMSENAAVRGLGALRRLLDLLRARAHRDGQSAGFVTVAVAGVVGLVSAALAFGSPLSGGLVRLLDGHAWLAKSDDG